MSSPKIPSPAATPWIKWNAKDPAGPKPGEWHLWTMVIDGRRNYFSGSLVEVMGHLFLHWDGLHDLVPDNTVWFARVNLLEE